MEITQFFALLSKSSAAASLFTFGGIFIFLGIMLCIAYLRKSPFNIGIGYFQVSIGAPAVKQMQHTKCNALVLQKFRIYLTAKEKEVSRLTTEIFERQMNFCDEKVSVIRGMFMDEYRTLLAKKVNGVDVRSHECYRTYMMLVDLMVSEAIKDSTFKKSMKQNHLLDLTLDTWEDFINDKVSLTFSMLARFYDDNYPDTSLVTRTELDASNERLFEKIKPIITSMYRKAREITVEVTTKILMIQKDIDEECKGKAFDILCIEEQKEVG